MNKLTKRLKRLDKTYLLTLILIKNLSRKQPEKIKYIELLRDFCYNKENELFKKTDYYKFINLNTGNKNT